MNNIDDTTTHSAGKEARPDLRKFLRGVYAERRAKTRSYSLRDFAASLGTHHATLSSLLNGKRPLTAKAVIRLGRAVGLKDEQISAYLAPANARVNPTARRKVLAHDSLALDTFSQVALWYHDAILELLRVRNFKPSIAWVSKVLGVSRIECEDAVDRLTRLGLMKISREGGWQDLAPNNSTNLSPDSTSAALRSLQKTILEKSLEALTTVPRSRRDHTSTVLAFSEEDLPEIKERIRQFRFELAEFAQRRGVQADNVYQLAVSFFPLSSISLKEN